MSKQNIANCLKQLRKTSAYSANEIVEKLTEYDIHISAKTLYGYESGLSMPNADAFVALCRIYKCDNPMNIFGGISLSSEETALIEKYRSLDSFGQETVNITLGRETSRAEQVRSISDQAAELQAARRRIFAYYGKIAAAGTSYGFDEIAAGVREYPVTDENQYADYTIGVSGDSMEPEYYDGDVVFVKKTDHLNIGDVGIFQKDNGIYIKVAGENGLFSYNNKYAPLVNGGDVICLGKVIGKAPAESEIS